MRPAPADERGGSYLPPQDRQPRAPGDVLHLVAFLLPAELLRLVELDPAYQLGVADHTSLVVPPEVRASAVLVDKLLCEIRAAEHDGLSIHQDRYPQHEDPERG